MFFNWAQILALVLAIVHVDSVPTGLIQDASKADQVMRPKAKRAQEVLMFGNQQNRRTENSAASNVFVPTAEKRTLGTSGLEDVKAALAEDQTFSHGKQPSVSIFDGERLPPSEKNYDYGKVMMNEVGDDLPRNWDMPPYARYFGLDEDRRKRSESKNTGASTSGPLSRPTTVSPSSTAASPLPIAQSSPRSFAQAKRSLPLYQESRYKRALDREDLLALLSLWENGPRARNWRGYGNDEYENIEDDGNLMGLEDEDPRGGWLEGPVYAPHRFNIAPEISSSDIGIPRTHPVNSYEQYGNQYAPAYDNSPYETTQYRSLYPHNSYYPPEKRFMVSRKRSQQGYDTYSGRNLNDIVNFSQMMNSQPHQGYPNLPQRLLY
ncbi:prohormone-2 [Diachasma alloeum]|uniref:prohormone-2 n=1 Tax=Diachasma alloeum TaxID=454923 RepID=UPI0007382747|nr:prohormone-2 [Diachasma alloeum]